MDDFKVGIFDVFENLFMLSDGEIGDVAFFIYFPPPKCSLLMSILTLVLFPNDKVAFTGYF